MADTRSRFIRTVPFGGYDRTDVDKRLEALYAQVFELKNELRDAKLLLDKLRKGTDSDKAYESVLAVERAKLTELQVKNEAASEKLKRTEEESKEKDKTIASLREELQQAKTDLENAASELTAMRAGGDAAALGAVFVEAQKSKDMLMSAAQTEADKLKADSEKLAENMISDADNKAAMIIFEAEKRAAEIAAEALTKAKQMDSASENMKAVMLQDVLDIRTHINTLRQALVRFESEGLHLVASSEQLLADTESELKKGGVPVFSEPGIVQPEYPEPPELQQVDFSAETPTPEEVQKKNAGLDRLQAMAEALTGGKNDDAPKSGDDKKSKTSLADLAKQAEAISGKSSGDSKKTSGGDKKTNLADLAKQAAAISGGASGDSSEKTGGSGKGKVSLADLAKQAESLNKGKKS